jgi:predicted Zn-dependent peptidase
VVRLLRDIWKQFAREGFDAGAVSQARWALVRNESVRYQTTMEIARGVFEALNHGWPLDFPGRYVDEVAAVTSEELVHAFAVCRASTVVSVIGNEPMLRAGLR